MCIRDRNDRIANATAVHFFGSYVAPFADLTGGVSGLNRTSNSHILTNLGPLLALSNELSETNPAFADAIDTVTRSTTPVERHNASLAVARAMLESAAIDTVINDFDRDESSHEELLALLERTGEAMVVNDRTDRRWTADSEATFTIGNGS